MSRARQLTNGPTRRRVSDHAAADFAALRHMTLAARPDLDTFRATLDRVANHQGPTPAGHETTYTNARRRYNRLVGQAT